MSRLEILSQRAARAAHLVGVSGLARAHGRQVRETHVEKAFTTTGCEGNDQPRLPHVPDLQPPPRGRPLTAAAKALAAEWSAHPDFDWNVSDESGVSSDGSSFSSDKSNVSETSSVKVSDSATSHPMSSSSTPSAPALTQVATLSPPTN